ncbi:MAG: PfkB family carbohydrate kinase, partial [Megasphaera massiliensis]|uniref:PfkB family carbohydrate kinase n=1 Tax=Megasphaera massiliensis TaxID=1232428 RepID=UPI002E77E184
MNRCILCSGSFISYGGIKMKNVLTIGEAMGLLIAEEAGPLESVEHFSRHVCGAELNYAVGMARLGNNVSYISK